MKPISLLAGLIVLCLCLGGCSFETETPDLTSASIGKPSATVSSTTGIIPSTTTSTTVRSTATTASTTEATTTTTTASTTTATSAAVTTASTTIAPEHNNVEALVWIPQSGSKYHRKETCSNMKNPSQVIIGEAMQRGYKPCKKCYK